jgi:hypothetical protein
VLLLEATFGIEKIIHEAELEDLYSEFFEYYVRMIDNKMIVFRPCY